MASVSPKLLEEVPKIGKIGSTELLTHAIILETKINPSARVWRSGKNLSFIKDFKKAV